MQCLSDRVCVCVCMYVCMYIHVRVCVLETLINQLNQESPNAAAAAGVCEAAVGVDVTAALLLLTALALSAVLRTIQSVGATETRRLFVLSPRTFLG